MRRADREIVDLQIIKEILDKAKIIHLGLSLNDEPYVVPLHYGYELKDNLTFYMHGAKVGKKIDLINTNPKAFIEIDTDIEDIDGGDIACMYGSTYSSIMGKGIVSIVEDIDEKIYGLRVLMKTQTGRDFEINEAMCSSVALIKVVLSDYSAKARKK